jgi:hypothetical protein
MLRGSALIRVSAEAQGCIAAGRGRTCRLYFHLPLSPQLFGLSLRPEPTIHSVACNSRPDQLGNFTHEVVAGPAVYSEMRRLVAGQLRCRRLVGSIRLQHAYERSGQSAGDTYLSPVEFERKGGLAPPSAGDQKDASCRCPAPRQPVREAAGVGQGSLGPARTGR